MEDDEDKKSEENKYKETCIGIWTRGTKGEHKDINWICNGISIVRIDKDVNRSNIKPSQTRGLQIIIQEMAEKVKGSQESDDIDSKRDPQRHVFPPEDPDLGKRLVNILRKKSEKIEQEIEHYIEEGVNLKDAWHGFSDIVVSCYQTSTRILSYCKPKEKLHQIYNFASSRIKNFGIQWKDDSDDSKNNKK